MKNCCFIIPYFGTFPNYFPLFLKTCSWNKNFNWLLITDNNTHYEYPENFNVIKMSFVELQTLVQSKFDFNIKLCNPYKLCDYKPAYGYIFEEYINDFKFWAHCDVDTLMGNLSSFITEDLLDEYDKIFCIGHMVLYKNNYENNRRFMSKFKNRILYKDVFTTNKICWFDEEYHDEYNINQLFLSLNRKVFKTDFSLNLRALPTKFVRTRYLGTDIYKYNHGYKVETYREAVYTWDNGHIFRYYMDDDNLKREEFLYAHFLHRKMSMDKHVLDLDIFKFIPNKFLPLEASQVSVENFKKIKKYSFNTHYINVKIKPKLKKILHFIHA